MSQPISHKLAPFLKEYELECEAPIAPYASYFDLNRHCEDREPKAWRDVAIQTDADQLHLKDKADFLKTIYSKDLDVLLDLFCVDCNSHVKMHYLLGSSRLDYRFFLSFDAPYDFHVPSLSSHYASANWLERECFDLFGIRFEGHPHLKRLILYPEFAGYPLRKNYPIDKAQPLIPIYA